MDGDEDFASFHAREAPRLRLLLDLLVIEPRRRERVLAQSWLILRHRWPGSDRPDLWLLALALRLLRSPDPPTPRLLLPVDAPAATVVAALATLDPPARQVVVLQHILGLPAGEVAEVVDLPPPVVDELRRGGLDLVRLYLGPAAERSS